MYKKNAVGIGLFSHVKTLFYSKQFIICKAADHVTETIYILCFREKQTGDSKLGKDHLVAMPFDYDNMSLMSYNSIRDCTPSATPKTAPTVQCYPGQLPQSAYENLQVHVLGVTFVLLCRV